MVLVTRPFKGMIQGVRTARIWSCKFPFSRNNHVFNGPTFPRIRQVCDQLQLPSTSRNDEFSSFVQLNSVNENNLKQEQLEIE